MEDEDEEEDDEEDELDEDDEEEDNEDDNEDNVSDLEPLALLPAFAELGFEYFLFDSMGNLFLASFKMKFSFSS
jgi:hypothetical protein